MSNTTDDKSLPFYSRLGLFSVSQLSLSTAIEISSSHIRIFTLDVSPRPKLCGPDNCWFKRPSSEYADYMAYLFITLKTKLVVLSHLNGVNLRFTRHFLVKMNNILKSY
jgi:hypothetical protein